MIRRMPMAEAPADPSLFYARHVFMCTNVRPEGHPRGCCTARAEEAGGVDKLRGYMREKARQLGIESIRFNAAGCLDRCEFGPNMVIYPEGLWYPGPNSATGEDAAEFHLHGGRAVLAALMRVLGRLGLRLAEPGEFTRRAFLNGKLDLLQAEAIADLAAAETEAQRRQALRQLGGELGDVYRGWRDRLTRLLAHLEAAIDFPDEDLPPEIEERILDETEGLVAEIERHLADGHRGERLRDGIDVAILGPPNAGKSSLLNRIARRDVAITSPVPGTTRDVIEVAIDLGGYPVVLADTAGLRDSADAIEQEGKRRAVKRAEQAEIRLFVFDIAQPADATGASPWPGADT